MEAFYLEDFAELEKEFPNFKFHLALDRPDPAADAAGVKYTPGFVHNVMYETYLKNHETPEDIKYFMCGPPMMVASVNNLLDSLGVPNGEHPLRQLRRIVRRSILQGKTVISAVFPFFSKISMFMTAAASLADGS